MLYFFRTSSKDILVNTLNTNYEDLVDLGPPGTYAMVSLFSLPDPTHLQNSFNVMMVCEHQPRSCLYICPAHEIESIVIALPYPGFDDYWYIFEELGLDIAHWGEPDVGEREVEDLLES